MADEPELLTAAQVAQMFRVDPKSVQRWADQGKLSFFRTPGGHQRYFADEVRELQRRTLKTREEA